MASEDQRNKETRKSLGAGPVTKNDELHLWSKFGLSQLD